jgi:hypothetical protein
MLIQITTAAFIVSAILQDRTLVLGSMVALIGAMYVS